MNRRGFLGFFGAGAVAGPKLAAGIAEGAGQAYYPPIGVPMPSGGGTEAGDWRINRIKILKSVLSGKNPDKEREDQGHRLSMAENVERVRLDGLRSISPVNKMRILIDGNPSRQEKIHRVNAKYELANLLSGKY